MCSKSASGCVTREVVEVPVAEACPRCGKIVKLTSWGRYVNTEVDGFGFWLEGWCANCAERVLPRG